MAQPTYTISEQVQRSRLRAGGGFEEVMEVYFTTSHNVRGSVCVPLASYSAETVAAAIAERVAHIDAVANL